MKKITILIISIFIFTFNSNAQYSNFHVDTTTKVITCGDSVQLSANYTNIGIVPTIQGYDNIFFQDSITWYSPDNYGIIFKTSNAGVTWSTLTSGTTKTLFSIYFTDANTGYAVGNYGTIIKTTNAGYTWSTLTSGTTIHLKSVYFTDTYTGYALAYTGAIIKTANAGLTWFPLISDTTKDLYSIYFTDTYTGYAVGQSGTINKTTNAGTTWSTLTSGTTNSLISIFFTDANTGYAVGGAGTIIKTTNAGATWSTLATNTTAGLSSIYFTDSNTGYAIGSAGTIIKTTNAGATWSTLTSGTTNNLNSIYFKDANIGYIGGNPNLKTTNAGVTWSKFAGIIGNTASFGLNSIYFFDANTGYAVGNNGRIIKTINAGAIWSTLTSTTIMDLKSIFFTDANTGYAVGQSTRVFKTIDAGATWIQSQFTSTNPMCNSIFFPNPDTGYIAGNNIFKTTNAGATWLPVSNGAATSIYFTDSYTGYIVNGGIGKTTDGGINWNTLSIGTSASLTSIFFTDANTGYAVGYNGIIIKTTNAGATWSTLSSGTTNHLKSIYFTDANNGFAVGDDETILITTNGGIIWTTLSSGTSPLTSVYFADANNGYAVGASEIIKITLNKDVSINWQPATGLNNPNIPNPIAKINSSITYKATISTNSFYGFSYVDSVNIQISPLTVDAGLNSTVICGDSIQLDATPNLNNLNYTYTWTPNNLYIKNPKVAPNILTNYIVTLHSNNGCGNPIDSIKVNVNPLLVDAGQNKSNFCGNILQLDSVLTNLTEITPLTYSWYPIIGLNSSTIPNPHSTETGITYTVTVNTPNGCSASDNISIIQEPIINPDICIVGVDSTDKNIIIWNKPISTIIDSFFVFRETNVTGIYEKIGSVSYQSSGNFVDNASNPNIQSNKYKISLIDTCGLESDKSDYHRTMHLTINQGVGTTWNLIWDSYEGFIVSTYKIYRGTTKYNLQLIGTTSGGSNQYSDFSAPTGYVYYQIEVISPNSCNYTKSINSTRSNIATNNPNTIQESMNKQIICTIYPNPANNQINVQIIPNLIGSNYTITDQIGKIVMSGKLNAEKSIIELGDLSGGIYLFSIGNNAKQTFKVIKKD